MVSQNFIEKERFTLSQKRPSQTPVLIVYVVTMLISMVVFGFAALVLLDRFVTQPKLARQAEAESSLQTDDALNVSEKDYSNSQETIIFIGADGNNINGIALLRIIPDELSVRIIPVSPMVYSSVDGTEGSLSSLYSTGGLNYLISGVESAFGIETDHYIKITNDGWKSLVEYLGGVSNYSFPQDMYYKNEETGEITSFSQGASTRTLWGDDLRRIITYPLYNGGNETKAQVTGELSAALINSVCSYNSGSVISNMQSIFNVIYNNSETDVTSQTFSDVRDAYEYLISNTLNPASYRMPTGEWDANGYFRVSDTFKSEAASYFGLSE